MRMVFVSDNKYNALFVGSDELIYLPTNEKSNLNKSEDTS